LRDYLVLAIILFSVPVALVSPYYGVLMWSWLAYFNPHRYAWGMAREFPVAIVIAIPTLIGAVFATKNRRIFTRETIVLCMLWLWFVATTVYVRATPAFAGHLADANDHLQEVSKILLMTFVTILLVTSKEKLRILVLVILASFGIRALVATVFFISTGGQYKIWGPEGTFLADNNDFALGLNMTIPMFFFMARAEPRKWMRVFLRVLMVCVAISVIGTYSRGGLIGLGAVTLGLLAKSRRKVLSLSLVAVAMFCLLTFATLQWKERMGDFLHGDLDQSAESRLSVWHAGWNLVQDYPFTGGGFGVYTDPSVIVRYLPDSAPDSEMHGPHSIYFQILGEQGFVGLGLFLLLLGVCGLRLWRIRRLSRQYDALAWAAPYADMFAITLLAYMLNGATLGRAYFDFFYEIVGCVVILDVLVRNDAYAMQEAEEPALNDSEELVAVPG
jgi:putative inorganic carbon (hco3(-)) transporter